MIKNMFENKNWAKTLFLLILTIVAFLYRYKGLQLNSPFWVDEFSTAKEARYFLQYGLGAFNNPALAIEHHNIVSNFLVALFFKILGQQEWIARLPFVIIGSFVPLAVFLLSKKIFGLKTAISAALLTAFSYIEITWSLQARGYILQQLLVLFAFFTYSQILSAKKSNWKLYLFLGVIFILGILTHVMFYLLIAAMIIHFTIVERNRLRTYLKETKNKLIAAIFMILFFAIIYIQGLFSALNSSFLYANNFWYYHSFLWRQYGLITFLGLNGLIIGLLRNKKNASLMLLYISFQLIFVSFIFAHYLTKYILPIFPLLFIGTAYIISETTDLVFSKYFATKIKLAQKLNFLIPILIILFIIVNGDKFVTKPKIYYSLNKDFREISNIDYDQIYSIIRSKDDLTNTAVIETWPDRARWYLGNEFKNLYLFRWQNELGRTSGHIKTTLYSYNEKGEKVTRFGETIGFIGDASDLKKAMNKYSKGFIFIDDSTLPHDVIAFAETGLKKELHLDHYFFDDNPYSIWPATLYSWGIK